MEADTNEKNNDSFQSDKQPNENNKDLDSAGITYNYTPLINPVDYNRGVNTKKKIITMIKDNTVVQSLTNQIYGEELIDENDGYLTYDDILQIFVGLSNKMGIVPPTKSALLSIISLVKKQDDKDAKVNLEAKISKKEFPLMLKVFLETLLCTII